MPIIAVGPVRVPVAGTPVHLLTALLAAGQRFQAFNAIHLQVLTANTGSIYLGTIGLNRSTLAACIHVLLAPTDTNLPSFGIAHMLSPAGVDVSDLYLDADQSTDGVLISVLET